jgi:alkylation response protein AidB-like acyl-CoA dehydrogenase
MNVLTRLDAAQNWNQEESMLLDSVRQLARQKIAPRAAAYDKSGEFPWDNVQEINALGLNAMFIPEEYGGAPLSYACYLACVRELSQACASTGIIWATNFHAIKPLMDFGNEEQKKRLLPRIAEGGLASLVITEPTAGSDATGMKTTFTPDGDSIIVNGSKIFISNGDVSDLYIMFGKWSEIPGSKESISAVVLEKGTPGFSVTGTEDKMGTRASGTASLAFDHARIPRANLLCAPGDGLNNRSQSGKRLLEFQGLQFNVADLAAELVLVESWLWRVAQLIQDDASDVGIEASILKLKATDLAMRMATDAVQFLGGYGYCKDYRVERLMRDAKITQIWEGTNQVHRQLIGRSFLRKDKK